MRKKILIWILLKLIKRYVVPMLTGELEKREVDNGIKAIENLGKK